MPAWVSSASMPAGSAAAEGMDPVGARLPVWPAACRDPANDTARLTARMARQRLPRLMDGLLPDEEPIVFQEVESRQRSDEDTISDRPGDQCGIAEHESGHGAPATAATFRREDGRMRSAFELT